MRYSSGFQSAVSARGGIEMRSELNNGDLAAEGALWRPPGFRGEVLLLRLDSPTGSIDRALVEARRWAYRAEARALVLFFAQPLDESELRAGLF